MKGIRVGAALLAAVAVASGAAMAQAGRQASRPPLKLVGTLSGYVKATKTKPGTITISVAASSVPGAYEGKKLKLTLTTSAKVHMRFGITDGDFGMVVLLYESLGAPVTDVYDEN
jgi:hypothetical protein